MADERALKYRRLEGFRRSVPHVSANALSAVLAEVAAQGLPESRSRWQVAQARLDSLEELTPYGSILTALPLVTKSGSATDLLIASPFALLHRAYKEGGSFTQLLDERLAAVPNSPEAPWRLVMYADEVVPGNALSNDNRRKIWVMYYSFVELSAAALSHENNWFCMTAKRSSEVAKVSGGIAQVFGAVIKFIFGPELNLHTGGLVLTRPDGTIVRIFAKLGMILQDGGAHKLTWHCKGDAGTKLCMLCRNLVSKESDIVAEDGTNLLTCSLIHEHELDMATDADIREAVQRLAAFKETDTAVMFQKRQQAVGFRHEPHSMLLDPALEQYVFPATQFVHDWMHAVLVHGVFNTVVYLLLEALMTSGFRDIWSKLADYMTLWAWPKRVASAGLSDVFGSKRAFNSRKAKIFKCTASEGLSLYPILGHFILSVVLPSNRCIMQCRAYLALVDILDHLVEVPHDIITPPMLRRVIRTFLEYCIEANWRQHMHPKFHWLVHLPKMLERHGTLLTCWVHERKHRMIKRYASDVSNTTAFERSILAEVTCHHLAELKKTSSISAPGLVDPHAPTRCERKLLQLVVGTSELDCRTSPETRITPMVSCARQDVVLLKARSGVGIEAGEVLLHTEIDGVSYSIVSIWSCAATDTAKGAAEWRVVNEPAIVMTVDILTPVIFTEARAGIVRTLLPRRFR